MTLRAFPARNWRQRNLAIVGTVAISLSLVGTVATGQLTHFGTYVDIDAMFGSANTVSVESGFPDFFDTNGGANNGLWGQLDKTPEVGPNEAPITAQTDEGGDGLVYRANAGEGPGTENPAPVLEVTIDGLTPGQLYTLGAVYYDQPDSQNFPDGGWGVAASLDNVDFVGITQNNAGYDTGGTYIHKVIDASTGAPPTNAGGTLNRHEAFFGTANASGAGEILVYIQQHGNSRTNLDGVSYFEGQMQFTPTLTINRETGAMTLANTMDSDFDILGYEILSQAGALDAESWTSVAGNYDADGNGNVDANDPWTISSDPADPTQLAEAVAEGGDAGTLATGSPANDVDLGAAWIRSPVEDVQIRFEQPNGTFINGLVEYAGAEAIEGDFNFDGTVDLTDWTIFRSNSYEDLSGLSLAEAYRRGDLNSDGVNDLADLPVFRNIYNTHNGAGAFAAATSAVPEPATFFAGTVLLAGVLLLFRGRKPATLQAVAVVVVAGMLTAPATAQVTVLRTDDSQGGFTTSTPQLVDNPVEGVEPPAGDQDNQWGFSASNGQARVGDVMGPSEGSHLAGQVWVSRADGNNGEDNPQLTTTVSGFNPDRGHAVYLYQVMHPSQNWGLQAAIGPSPLQTYLRGDGVDIDVNLGGLILERVQLGLVSGVSELDVIIDDQPAGGSNRGFYKGLGVEEVARLAITVDTGTGEVTLANTSGGPLDLTGYSIESESSALDFSQWNSLQDQGFDGGGGEPPAGDFNNDGAVDAADYTVWRDGLGGSYSSEDYETWMQNFGSNGSTGAGWEEAGGSSNSVLAELRLSEQSTLADQDNISLGNAFDTAAGTQDLTFNYTNANEELVSGFVRYVSGGSSSAGSAVPEPSAVILGLTAAVALSWRRGRAKVATH